MGSLIVQTSKTLCSVWRTTLSTGPRRSSHSLTVRKLRAPSTHHSASFAYLFLLRAWWRCPPSPASGRQASQVPTLCPVWCIFWPLARVGLLTNGNGDEGFTQMSSFSHSYAVLSFWVCNTCFTSLLFTNIHPFLSLDFSENVTHTRFLYVQRMLETIRGAKGISCSAMMLVPSLLCHVFARVFCYQPLYYASSTLGQTLLQTNKTDSTLNCAVQCNSH